MSQLGLGSPNPPGQKAGRHLSRLMTGAATDFPFGVGEVVNVSSPLLHACSSRLESLCFHPQAAILTSPSVAQGNFLSRPHQTSRHTEPKQLRGVLESKGKKGWNR